MLLFKLTAFRKQSRKQHSKAHGKIAIGLETIYPPESRAV